MIRENWKFVIVRTLKWVLENSSWLYFSYPLVIDSLLDDIVMEIM